jgi:hypothetical protein
MTQSRQPLSLPVLPTTKRRTALRRSSAPLRVAPGWAKAKPANRFRYAGLAAMLAAGVVLIQAFVIFSILRDQAHLSQPSKISTPLRP